MGQQGLALDLCYGAAPALEIRCRSISSNAAAHHHDLAALIAPPIATDVATVIAVIA